MSGAGSRRKGKAAELELCRVLGAALEVRLERNLSQTRDGGHDLAVVPRQDHATARSLDAFALEVKRYSKATPGLIHQWWTQTTRQAEAVNRLPCLAYRANRSPWWFMVSWSAFGGDLPADHVATLSLGGFTALVRLRAATAAPGGTP